SGSTTISYSALFMGLCREMADSGQIVTHIPQSRQVPHDEHWEVHDSIPLKPEIRGSKYSSFTRVMSIFEREGQTCRSLPERMSPIFPAAFLPAPIASVRSPSLTVSPIAKILGSLVS